MYAKGGRPNSGHIIIHGLGQGFSTETSQSSFAINQSNHELNGGKKNKEKKKNKESKRKKKSPRPPQNLQSRKSFFICDN